MRHDQVGSQGREIFAHAWDSLVDPEVAWEPGYRSKSLKIAVVTHAGRGGRARGVGSPTRIRTVESTDHRHPIDVPRLKRLRPGAFGE